MTFVMFLILTTAFIVAKPVTVVAEEEQCFIVSFRGKVSLGSTASDPAEAQVSVRPENIRVPKGSCVVFMNWVPVRELMVNFKEGKIFPNNRPGIGVVFDRGKTNKIDEITEAGPVSGYSRPDGSFTTL